MEIHEIHNHDRSFNKLPPETKRELVANRGHCTSDSLNVIRGSEVPGVTRLGKENESKQKAHVFLYDTAANKRGCANNRSNE